MSPLFNHLLIPYLVALFLAINMGGSGTGPSFSAAYGADLIKKNLIPGLFGLFVFIGAIVAGKATATTVGRELIDPDRLTYLLVTIILFSISISLLIANLTGIPQSTSQSTVLAVAAPAAYFGELNSSKLFFEILPTWFILPIVSFIICWLLGKYLYKPIRRRGYFLSKIANNHPAIKVAIFITSLYVSFSIGANNVANASGPIASMTINELNITDTSSNFIVIIIISTLMIAPSFGIGSSFFGTKILQNTGKEIIMFGRFEAIIIGFVSASLLLLASALKGIPSSLVQVNVAAILGIGVAKLGFKNIFKKTEVSRFFTMWIIAPVISFLLALILTWLADYYGYL